jgi:hypothetical protein
MFLFMINLQIHECCKHFQVLNMILRFQFNHYLSKTIVSLTKCMFTTFWERAFKSFFKTLQFALDH